VVLTGTVIEAGMVVYQDWTGLKGVVLDPATSDCETMVYKPAPGKGAKERD
jgi:hypothetical protein